jgi:hypothetical protein
MNDPETGFSLPDKFLQTLAAWRAGEIKSDRAEQLVREQLVDLPITKSKGTHAILEGVARVLVETAIDANVPLGNMTRVFRSVAKRSATNTLWRWAFIGAAYSPELIDRVKRDDRLMILNSALIDTWPVPSKKTTLTKVTGTGNPNRTAYATQYAVTVLNTLRHAEAVAPAKGSLANALVQAALTMGIGRGTKTIIAGYPVAIPMECEAPEPVGVVSAQANPNATVQAISKPRFTEDDFHRLRKELEASKQDFHAEETRSRSVAAKLEDTAHDVDRLRNNLHVREAEIAECRAELDRLAHAVERSIGLERELRELRAKFDLFRGESFEVIKQTRAQSEAAALARCRQLASVPTSTLQQLSLSFPEDARQVLSACLAQLEISMRQPGEEIHNVMRD